jgi:hypothetical protein
MAIFVSTNYDGTNWIIAPSNNIALVPGTNTSVSVSSINGGYADSGGIIIEPSNPEYYVDNWDRSFSAAPPYAASAPVFNVQYDGMTVLLKAKFWISANVTNHIKIAIEDYKDPDWDSAVFIRQWEQGSCFLCE